MKILIDIGHPAHVHYFKNIVWIFIRKGHKVLFTCRDKEVVIDLLKSYNFGYINLGKPFKKSYTKIFGLFYFDLKILKTAIKFKPDIFISAGSFYAAHVSWLLMKPHITIEDTFNMEQVRLYLPFTNSIITGNYPHNNLGKNEIKIASYHELAYLHPNYFSPDRNILNELGIKKDERYFILRFVSWNASHDIGHKGISLKNKILLVKELLKYGKVFISSEKKINKELEPYRIMILPSRMHDAIAFSSLLFGESATMSSEAAMLGVPTIFIDNTGRYYTDEQEGLYKLVFNYKESDNDQQSALSKAIEIAKDIDSKEIWEKRRAKMLSEKIDFTAFLVWFIENYPESKKIMKENPDYQYNFK